MEYDVADWPKNGDSAFQADATARTNTTFNWLQMFGMNQMHHKVADGFKEAADMVVEGLASREDRTHADPFL
jgi:hypothetical protein